MAAGSLRVLLNWEETPADMDLYSFQVNKEDTRETCLTYHGNMNDCLATTLDQDNRNGGNNGVETVSYHEVAANARYTHMVYVDDASGRGASLAESKARVTITDGTRSVTVQMPEFDDSTSAGVRYWFAGCMEIGTVGETFKFVPTNTFSRDKPSDDDKLFCDKLFKESRSPLINQENVEPFCENVKMKVRIHNAVTNDPILEARADVHYISGSSEDLVAGNVTTSEDGSVAINVRKAGEYLINVRAEGFVRDQAFLNVDCDIARCSSCQPVILLSLSPELERGNVRIIMNWDEKPSDLDIYTFQTNIDDRSQTCTTKYNNKNGCQGVTLDKDNARGGTSGAETITFDDVSNNANFVYMVYVNDYSRRPEEFVSSHVHLTITDGIDNTKINMKTDNFNNQRFWFAGCMRMVGDTFDFIPSDAFTTNAPKDQVPEHCVNLFGLNIDPIACFEDNTNYPGNDMNNGHDNKKNDAVQCREDCLRTDGCVGFAWNKETNDCWLKPTMIQGKKEDNLFISGLAVCEDPTAPPPPPKPETSIPWWKRIFG